MKQQQPLTRKSVAITFDEPTMAKQSFQAECNINNIMAKYQKTGVVDHINNHQANYGDTTSDSFHDSMNIIADANSMFEELPSKVRKYFRNDPAQFLDYVQDPNNQDNLVDMGLATRSTRSPDTLVENEAQASSTPPLGGKAPPAGEADSDAESERKKEVKN
ncbi:MAG: hypothetical protein DRQ98_11485 [Gammaproteobacteria bacterium]|nr:MAG: hypothetical protein DRQ98_11485 [Gammaproteobacteria bacterium]